MSLVCLVLCLVLFLAPGYLALCALPRDVRDRVAEPDAVGFLSMAGSLAIVAAIQLATFLSGGPPGVTAAALLALVVVMLAARTAAAGDGWLEVRGLGAFIAAATWYALLVSMVPSYDTGFTSDWRLYFPGARMFLGLEPIDSFASGVRLEYLVKRTPVMTLGGALVMSLAGASYAVFQLACTVQNLLAWWGVRLVAGRLYGPAARRISGLLVLVGPAFLRQVGVPEPKMAAAACAVAALLAYARAVRTDCPRQGALAGALAVLAFVIHPATLLYTMWIGLHQLTRRRWVPDLWWAAALAALVSAPWFMWTVSRFGFRALVEPARTVSQPVPMTAGEWATTRLGMLVTTIVAPLTPASPLDGDSVLRFYDQTFLGGLTATIGVLAIWGVTRRRRDARAPLRAFVRNALLAGALACFAVHVGYLDYKGHATNVVAPLFLLFAAHAGHVLSRLEPLAASLVTTLASVELVRARWLVQELGRTRSDAALKTLHDADPALRELSWVAVLFALVAVLAIYGALEARRR